MRIQALDNDNVQLRNKLIATNEENFNLQAAIMVCEAESNYKAEQDLGQLKSQLGFKVSLLFMAIGMQGSAVHP